MGGVLWVDAVDEEFVFTVGVVVVVVAAAAFSSLGGLAAADLAYRLVDGLHPVTLLAKESL